MDPAGFPPEDDSDDKTQPPKAPSADLVPVLPPKAGRHITPQDLKTTADEADIPQYVKEDDQRIHITALIWDEGGGHGQGRDLVPSLVDQYEKAIRVSLPPPAPIRLLVIDRGGMHPGACGTSSSCVSVSDGTFCPLGGQHVAAALWRIYHWYRKNHTADEEVPENVRTVRGQVLAASTPLAVARLASGHHQRSQQNTSKVGCSQVLSFLLRNAQLRKAAGLSPQFSDDELFKCLLAVGIQLTDTHRKSSASPPKPSKTKTTHKNSHSQEVCTTVHKAPLHFTRPVRCCRSCHSGEPGPSLPAVTWTKERR